MPEIKKAGLSVAVIISAALGVSSCSMIPMFDGSPVSDNMKYRSNDASIKALSIPPELSKPAFDDSYALDKPVDPVPVTQQSNNDSPVMSRQSSTQDMLNSQDAPIQSGATPAAQAAYSEPAQAAPVANTAPPSSTSPRTQVMLTRVKSGEPALAVNAPVSNTWPRLAVMLPQVGFEVVKQQPAQGIYTITYKGDPAAAQNRGLLSRMLDKVDGVSLKSDQEAAAKSGSPLKTGETYLVLVVGNANQQSFVGVRTSDGKEADPAIASYILGLLKGQYEL